MSSHTYHPFSGWTQAGRGQSSQWTYDGSAAPSVFGALPNFTPSASLNLVTFYLTSFNLDVLNCTVIGPNQRPYLYIATDLQMASYTVFKDARHDRSIALVEWQTHSLVEIRNVMSKRSARSWLRLSGDRMSRTMEFNGVQYTWAPHDRCIHLYSSGSTPSLLARITRGRGTITLDMTGEAVQAGLVDASIIATFLPQCGRSIG